MLEGLGERLRKADEIIGAVGHLALPDHITV